MLRNRYAKHVGGISIGQKIIHNKPLEGVVLTPSLGMGGLRLQREVHLHRPVDRSSWEAFSWLMRVGDRRFLGDEMHDVTFTSFSAGAGRRSIGDAGVDSGDLCHDSSSSSSSCAD